MGMKTQSLIGTQVVVTVEKTRPANTTAYTDEDVFSESASAGTSWVFDAVVPTPGGSGVITKAQLQFDDTGVVPVCTVYLFNVLPTGNLNDNVGNTNPVYASESDNYVGRLDFAATQDLGGASEDQLVPNSAGMPLPFITVAGADELYGVLVIRSAAHTPSSEAKARVTLTFQVD
jgi:hypothetical protein